MLARSGADVADRDEIAHGITPTTPRRRGAGGAAANRGSTKLRLSALNSSCSPSAMGSRPSMAARDSSRGSSRVVFSRPTSPTLTSLSGTVDRSGSNVEGGSLRWRQVKSRGSAMDAVARNVVVQQLERPGPVGDAITRVSPESLSAAEEETAKPVDGLGFPLNPVEADVNRSIVRAPQALMEGNDWRVLSPKESKSSEFTPTSPSLRVTGGLPGDDDLEGDSFVGTESQWDTSSLTALNAEQSGSQSPPIIGFAAQQQFRAVNEALVCASEEQEARDKALAHAADKAVGERYAPPSATSIVKLRAHRRALERKKGKRAPFNVTFGPAFLTANSFKSKVKDARDHIDLRPVRRTVTGEAFLDPNMVSAARATAAGKRTTLNLSDSAAPYAHAPEFQTVERFVKTHVGNDPTLDVVVDTTGEEPVAMVQRLGELPAPDEVTLTPRQLTDRAAGAGGLARIMSMQEAPTCEVSSSPTPPSAVNPTLSIQTPESPVTLGGTGSFDTPLTSPSSAFGDVESDSDGDAVDVGRPAARAALSSPQRIDLLTATGSVDSASMRSSAQILRAGTAPAGIRVSAASRGSTRGAPARPGTAPVGAVLVPALDVSGFSLASNASSFGAVPASTSPMASTKPKGRTMSSLASQSMRPVAFRPFEVVVRGRTVHELQTRVAKERRADKGMWRKQELPKFRPSFVPAPGQPPEDARDAPFSTLQRYSGARSLRETREAEIKSGLPVIERGLDPRYTALTPDVDRDFDGRGAVSNFEWAEVPVFRPSGARGARPAVRHTRGSPSQSPSQTPRTPRVSSVAAPAGVSPPAPSPPPKVVPTGAGRPRASSNKSTLRRMVPGWVLDSDEELEVDELDDELSGKSGAAQMSVAGGSRLSPQRAASRAASPSVSPTPRRREASDAAPVRTMRVKRRVAPRFDATFKAMPPHRSFVTGKKHAINLDATSDEEDNA